MGGLDVIDGRYQGLYQRVLDVLGTDPRVAEVRLSGSVGTGTADQWSDLDLVVIAKPEHTDEVVRDWPTWLAAISPTVFARTPIAPFVINAVTADGLTLDIAVYGGPPPAFPPPQEYVVGMLSGRRFTDIGEAFE